MHYGSCLNTTLNLVVLNEIYKGTKQTIFSQPSWTFKGLEKEMNGSLRGVNTALAASVC